MLSGEEEDEKDEEDEEDALVQTASVKHLANLGEALVGDAVWTLHFSKGSPLAAVLCQEEVLTEVLEGAYAAGIS